MEIYQITDEDGDVWDLIGPANALLPALKREFDRQAKRKSISRFVDWLCDTQAFIHPTVHEYRYNK